MTAHTFTHTGLAAIADSIRAVTPEARAEHIPFAALNHLHAAIAQIEQADSIIADATENQREEQP